IYEDERLLIINKPAGLAVHGGSGVSYGVIEGFRQLRPDEPNLELAHRLDRDTSGCLILCKKRLYLKKIQAVLQDKSSLQKHYQAIVHGRWPKRKQHVDVPIRKNTLKSGERVCIVAADGKPSLTEFSVNRQNDQLSLLDVRPVTGRTHQIRVHAQYLKHPIVGDPKYGNPGLDAVISPLATPRLMLHAARLVLPPLDKGDKVLTVEAPPCERFMSLMNSI
ncbi:MAG: RluA family pseudouridine synthase, partial [Pseudomonadales bacterium]|nr:RluA family pseudouridine synthase [Pseudomonadales bacterium]